MCPRNMLERWKDWMFSSQLGFCAPVIPLFCGFLYIVFLHEHMPLKWMPWQMSNNSEPQVAPGCRIREVKKSWQAKGHWDSFLEPELLSASIKVAKTALQTKQAGLIWLRNCPKEQQKALPLSALNLQPAGKMHWQSCTNKVLRNWGTIVSNSPNSLLSAG